MLQISGRESEPFANNFNVPNYGRGQLRSDWTWLEWLIQMVAKGATQPLLHDVVEDTPWTFEQLGAEGFSQVVLNVLDSVTVREGEAYTDFAARAGRNEIGRRVKMADIRDNMDISRIAEPTERDLKRIERYAEAFSMLEGKQKRECWCESVLLAPKVVSPRDILDGSNARDTEDLAEGSIAAVEPLADNPDDLF